MRARLAAAAMLAAACALAAPAPAAAAEVTWRMQTSAGAATTELDALVRNFADRVAEASDGRMRIDVFPAGQLVPTPEVVEAVRAGALELGHTYLVYYVGREPALFGINEWAAGYDPLQGVGWFYDGGGAELLRPVLAEHGLHYLGVSPLLGEQLWFSDPVESLDALSGVKIRSTGLTADAFSRLGAAIVSMPAEEIYTGLQRGVIDGAEFTSLPIHHGLGWQEVAPYVVMPPFTAGGSSDWIVNSDAWEALPDDLKGIVDAALRAAAFDYYRAAIAEEARLVRDMEAGGTTFLAWPEEDMRRIEATRVAVMKEVYLPRSEAFAAAFASRNDYLRSLGHDIVE
ncbi:TRAP transporter substrate-binding protein DctP [Salinarimonas ramus]|uniref:Lactate-binding periplasmic protein n=1 Tax=Salinarimonas ramus TaxID=690164 RepID=A0A917Q9M3_9HYPH|nr:TRAP transporter substrate-binding protein DctP [Salinarimonas ramus]GGK37566.1 lactate-binding periplasmic protein [Salinarimonas ramus]